MLKKGLKFSIVIAVICLSSVMCKGGFDIKANSSTNFNIQGKVTDAKDGTAIRGALVGISSLFADSKCLQSTDGNGDYYIRNCPVLAAGRTRLYVGNQGYTEKWVDLEITSNLQIINVALERRAP